MPVGWRWHVDPHHSWSSSSWSRPHRPLSLPHWQEEEPRWLSDHLSSLVTLVFPWGQSTLSHPEINLCFMRLNTSPPPVPHLSLHPSSLCLCVCCSSPSSVTLVIISLCGGWYALSELTCSFIKNRGGDFVWRWRKLFTGTMLKGGMDVDQRVHESPQNCNVLFIISMKGILRDCGICCCSFSYCLSAFGWTIFLVVLPLMRFIIVKGIFQAV